MMFLPLSSEPTMNLSRPTQGRSGAVGDSSMEFGDWRDQLPADSRRRTVNTILDSLNRHVLFSGHEGLQELEKTAVRFEEKIYTSATSQLDYLQTISLKMQTLETRLHNLMPAAKSVNSSEGHLSVSTKDLMNNGKLVRMIRREIRGKDAVFGTPTPQQFAGGTCYLWNELFVHHLNIASRVQTQKTCKIGDDLGYLTQMGQTLKNTIDLQKNVNLLMGLRYLTSTTIDSIYKNYSVQKPSTQPGYKEQVAQKNVDYGYQGSKDQDYGGSSRMVLGEPSPLQCTFLSISSSLCNSTVTATSYIL